MWVTFSLQYNLIEAKMKPDLTCGSIGNIYSNKTIECLIN